MNIKDVFQSKIFRRVLVGIGVAIIALVIFQAGIFVGYRKSGFSYRWGENYYRTFGEHRGRFGKRMPGFPRGRDFSNSHGATGKIVRVDLPTAVIADEDGVEKIIAIKDDTIIRRFRETVKPTDLKPDDFVTVIGSPNDQSQIEAKLIRLLPSPPDFMPATGTRGK